MSEEVTKEQKIEAHKVLQGERVTKKKKVSKFTKEECQAELDRLTHTNHQNSLYQKALSTRLKYTQGFRDTRTGIKI